MKVESSIKENSISSTTPPIKNTEEIIDIICQWNWITIGDFKNKTWPYHIYGKDSNGWDIYVDDFTTIVNPIGLYLRNVYQWKTVVFEKNNDKFFWKISIWMRTTRYQLGDKIIEIPFEIKAINQDTQDGMIIFPKASDFIQERMEKLYVVNTGWAERQRIEKEIMAKLIELAQVRGWNEIISTQNMLEELKTTLAKRKINLKLEDWMIYLDFPMRKIRDVMGIDGEYIAAPMIVKIDFNDRSISSKGYSSHWFGTATSRGHPCWWNWENDIRHGLAECDIKGLINLIISRAYGYNSDDTWTSYADRHPVSKLYDYIYWVYDRRNDSNSDIEKAKQEIRDNLAEVRTTLEVASYYNENENIKNFLSSLETTNEADK